MPGNQYRKTKLTIMTKMTLQKEVFWRHGSEYKTRSKLVPILVPGKNNSLQVIDLQAVIFSFVEVSELDIATQEEMVT